MIRVYVHTNVGVAISISHGYVRTNVALAVSGARLQRRAGVTKKDGLRLKMKFTGGVHASLACEKGLIHWHGEEAQAEGSGVFSHGFDTLAVSFDMPRRLKWLKCKKPSLSDGKNVSVTVKLAIREMTFVRMAKS